VQLPSKRWSISQTHHVHHKARLEDSCRKIRVLRGYPNMISVFVITWLPAPRLTADAAPAAFSRGGNRQLLAQRGDRS
jgi:hypothetical protein